MSMAIPDREQLTSDIQDRIENLKGLEKTKQLLLKDIRYRINLLRHLEAAEREVQAEIAKRIEPVSLDSPIEGNLE